MGGYLVGGYVFVVLATTTATFCLVHFACVLVPWRLSVGGGFTKLGHMVIWKETLTYHVQFPDLSAAGKSICVTVLYENAGKVTEMCSKSATNP